MRTFNKKELEYISPNAYIPNWYPEITAMAKNKTLPGLFSYHYGFKWYSEKNKEALLLAHLETYIDLNSKGSITNEERDKMRKLLNGMVCGFTKANQQDFENTLENINNRNLNASKQRLGNLCPRSSD